MGVLRYGGLASKRAAAEPGCVTVRGTGAARTARRRAACRGLSETAAGVGERSAREPPRGGGSGDRPWAAGATAVDAAAPPLARSLRRLARSVTHALGPEAAWTGEALAAAAAGWARATGEGAGATAAALRGGGVRRSVGKTGAAAASAAAGAAAAAAPAAAPPERRCLFGARESECGVTCGAEVRTSVSSYIWHRESIRTRRSTGLKEIRRRGIWMRTCATGVFSGASFERLRLPPAGGGRETRQL